MAKEIPVPVYLLCEYRCPKEGEDYDNTLEGRLNSADEKNSGVRNDGAKTLGYGF